jgi:type VI protein secretion system component VasK
MSVSVAAHPRARASVRRIRAWTAIAAFAIVLLLALDAGVPGQEATLRALVAGLAGNLVGWACALAVWRRLVLAELEVVEQVRRDRLRARAEAESS